MQRGLRRGHVRVCELLTREHLADREGHRRDHRQLVVLAELFVLWDLQGRAWWGLRRRAATDCVCHGAQLVMPPPATVPRTTARNQGQGGMGQGRGQAARPG